jgi:hypothetical protein
MLLLLLAACQPEYSLSAISVEDESIAAEALEEEAFQPSEDLGMGAAVASWEKEAGRMRMETFQFGPSDTPVADYLFVIDDSTSMNRMLEKFHRGIDSLIEPGAFPAHARIAVMNTTPADAEKPRKPHGLVPYSDGYRKVPGFRALVSKRRIEAYREIADPAVAERFDLDGCTSWFSPQQLNSQGHPCLEAHTQLSLLRSKVEAGSVSLRQWLERTAGKERFRPGAAVNIVFISDTHDPGMLPPQNPNRSEAYEDLLDQQPSYGELMNLVEKDDLVSSFRLHAIAPMEECGESWEIETYALLAEESDGLSLDFCEAEDYGALIKEIAEAGAKIQRPVFPLGYTAQEIQSVSLEGEEVDWSLKSGGRVLVVGGDFEGRGGSLEIQYTRRGKERNKPSIENRSRPVNRKQAVNP